ncbi:MAG: hypothetical protein CFE43_20215 [Burkholderiales bacterium PBB3]|nr:MAG: hypothetical protein CFE43_20215 [Burkholderiales bacterium PBB3]
MTLLESQHPSADVAADSGAYFNHKTVRESGYANQCGIAIIGALGASCNKLIDVCQHQGIYFRIFPNVSALAHYDGPQELNLAIVVGGGIDVACRPLLDSLRRVGAQRSVLIGPGLDSIDYPLALDAGFDEVWPESIGVPVLKALVNKSWQTTIRVAKLGPDKAPNLGAMVLHPESCSCTISGSVAYLSRSCFVVLQCLVSNYPEPVSRTSLFTALGKIVPGLDARSRAVDMAVYRLRKQLANAGVSNLEIRTIEHVGYGLTVGHHPLQ